MKIEKLSVADIERQSIAAYRQGRMKDAIDLCSQGLRLDPSNNILKVRYAHFIEQFKTSTFDPDIKKNITLCLKHPHIEHQKLGGIWWSTTLSAPLYAFLFTPTIDDQKYWRSIDTLLNDEFFILGIKKLNPANINIERALIKLRKTLLLAHQDDGRLRTKHLPLLCALAIQNFYNEYVWAQDEEETALLNAMPFNNPIGIALTACYRPLMQHTAAPQWLHDYTQEPMGDMLRLLVGNPLTEQALRNEIKSFSTVTAGTSQDVQTMYEQNPYPRWSCVDRPSVTFTDVTADWLTAGCGTGRPLTQAAAAFPNVRFTAIDLSRSSLAYAMRQTREAGATNIDFFQGDILNAADLGKDFDFIESSGVLHHMKEPVTGWRALLTRLRPGGRMLIGLYSQTARRAITQVRDHIKEQGYNTDLNDIRRLRHDLITLPEDHPFKPVTRRRDFFSTSECRDLLFHVQEHVYTIPEISHCLNELGLAFLGFKASPGMTSLYMKRFPADPAMINLDNWQTLEQENPLLFIQMYNFFCCRKAETESPAPNWVILEKSGILRA